MTRGTGESYADYPKRYSYLIAPNGMIARAYDVTDVAGHAAQVVQDLIDLGAAPTG